MVFQSPSSHCTSYAQWVRRTIRRVRSSGSLMVSLFESSVPEPVELLREIVEDGFSEPLTSRYTSAFSSGNPFVLSHLAAHYGLPESSILCTTGATGALSLVYRALLEPGDRILIESPCFDLFHTIAQSQGHAVDSFERSGPAFAIDPDEVAANIRPDTRLIVLSNLHNPSGMLVPDDVVRDIATRAAKVGAAVVVDEVYASYADGAGRRTPAVHLAPNVISIDSMTKRFGLSTLRCGWLLAHPHLMRPIRELNDAVEFSVSNLAHAVAALALERKSELHAYSDGILDAARPVIEAYHAYWRARELVDGELPQFGCIAFPRLIGVDETEEFSDWLAARGSVVVAPGEYFGRAGHVRLGFGIGKAQLDYGLQTLTDGLVTWRDNEAARRQPARTRPAAPTGGIVE
ncbi:aminotransferase [Pacificimonas flava]|uniref:Aminotransferase n=2 Tax=Pacificimonas TaxID=1960290 RepID=A0A219B332_9SPHN|nr:MULTISPECIES: pyridoxal phosphate-dependent aminotransferase [Pacificimonas]MBZ6377588.1 pyridoxal phosphate-dependent aminotransferase [Pacificimonas aurantium]OWV32721.1 aminotransferase [Pacificimonas flava]